VEEELMGQRVEEAKQLSSQTRQNNTGGFSHSTARDDLEG